MDENLLIRKIKNRDEDGLLEFINKYAGVLKSSIYPVLIHHPNLMEEVLNDSVLAVWENINSYDKNRSSFKNWCAAVSKYKAIDAFRKEIIHQSISIDEVGEVFFEEDYEINEIDLILKILSTEDKEIFIKLFVEEYSYEEISKSTGLSKEVLYNRVSREKKLLRDNLQGGNKWIMFTIN